MTQFSEHRPRRSQTSWPDGFNNFLDRLFLPNEGTGDGERSPYAESSPELAQAMISSAYSPVSKQESFLDTFTLFPDLPIELRRSIWKFSAGRRVVEIMYNQFTRGYESTTAISAILHATRESREVALECYDLCFSTNDAEPAIYFDFSIDALYLGVGSLAPIRYPFQQFLKSVNGQDLSHVRSLFLEDEYVVEFVEEGKVLNLSLYEFDGLQELTIVADNGRTKKRIGI